MQYQTKLSAGLDLCTLSAVGLAPLRRVVVDTGVYLQDVMPPHMVTQVRQFHASGLVFSDVPFAMVCSRSGLAAKEGVIVLNAPGIIDADYEDTIKVVLFNTSDRVVRLHEGARIAQLVFAYAYRHLELIKDEYRQGGLGSTGTGEKP
jgi:dUTP pyrophosphatase